MLKRLIILILFYLPVKAAIAECNVALSVVTLPQNENISEYVLNSLNNRLEYLASQNDIIADSDISIFYIAGKFNHLYEERLPGPPKQTIIKTTLTVVIGDVLSSAIYASSNIELRGIGDTDQKALLDAIKGLQAKNAHLVDLFKIGKERIISHFNENYNQYIVKAQRAAEQGQYAKALWILGIVPECCIGYKYIEDKTLEYYLQHIELAGSENLHKAKIAWAANPNDKGAKEALSLLIKISPESSVFPEVEDLINEIKTTIKEYADFEIKQMYNDQIQLERAKIEAAKEIGIAYGKNSQQSRPSIIILEQTK